MEQGREQRRSHSVFWLHATTADWWAPQTHRQSENGPALTHHLPSQTSSFYSSPIPQYFHCPVTSYNSFVPPKVDPETKTWVIPGKGVDG